MTTDVTGLMEDAAVQAGSNSGKSRACQTPYSNSRSVLDSTGDLSRTQSLPLEPHDWLAAFASTETHPQDFGDVVAEYAQKVRLCLQLCCAWCTRISEVISLRPFAPGSEQDAFIKKAVWDLVHAVFTHQVAFCNPCTVSV